MDDINKVRKCRVLVENCGVNLKKCKIRLRNIAFDTEQRDGKHLLRKTRKKLRERFIVSKQFRKKKSVGGKYIISLPVRDVESLGEDEASDEKKLDLVSITDFIMNNNLTIKIESKLSDEFCQV